MSHTVIDTLKFAKKLREAGVPFEQAEAQAEAFSEAVSESIDNTLATKSDIADLKTATKADIAEVKAGQRLQQLQISLLMVIAIIPAAKALGLW